MDNNDVLRKLRFILNYRDKKTAEIFAKGQLTLSTDDIDKLLKKEDDPVRKILATERLLVLQPEKLTKPSCFYLGLDKEVR